MTGMALQLRTDRPPADPQRAAPQRDSVSRRVRVQFARERLDGELADGHQPGASDLHALRARQLADPLLRSRVAVLLREIVDDAEQPYRVLKAVPLRRAQVLVPLRSGEVLLWREGLLGLAERLDGPAPVNPCGVARARVLLSDGMGALYNPSPQRSLGDAIWWIAEGLEVLAAEPDEG